tara:strand:- start:44 stop:280 length:237 start_codon:yes stop_codon:yes gene_type:complete
METEVKWGTTVHPDNTILKQVISKFEDKETMFHVWNRTVAKGDLPKMQHHMDIEGLTITSQEFVSFDEYLEYMEDEEE